jgi:hypothetical protein
MPPFLKSQLEKNKKLKLCPWLLWFLRWAYFIVMSTMNS